MESIDVLKNKAYVNIGTSKDTREFACDSIRANMNIKLLLLFWYFVMQEEVIPIGIIFFRDTLENVKEYYERRYYRDESTSISLGQIDKIDEIYFYLRNSLNENFPHFMSAYLNNKHFKSRKHPVVNQMLPDGRIICNDGCKDEIINNL